MGLVDYGSSSEDSDVEDQSNGATSAVIQSGTPCKRKRDSTQEATHAHTPQQNFGAPGEWLNHVFVAIPSDHPALIRLLSKIKSRLSKSSLAERLHWLAFAEQGSEEPTASASIHRTASYWDSHQPAVSHLPTGSEEKDDLRLHISLTKPILIRAQERSTFFLEAGKAVRSASEQSDQEKRLTLRISFSRISVLTSSTTPRAFLTLEVGKGHDDLLRISESLSSVMRTAFQASGYWGKEEVRFHASFACFDLPNICPDGRAVDEDSEVVLSQVRNLAETLEEHFGGQLRSKVGEMRLGQIGVSCGKIHRWIDLLGNTVAGRG